MQAGGYRRVLTSILMVAPGKQPHDKKVLIQRKTRSSWLLKLFHNGWKLKFVIFMCTVVSVYMLV